MKKISMLLVVTLLCTIFQFTGSLAYAVVPYSGIVLDAGLKGSMGIIIGPDDKVYVSDYSGNKIIKMDKDGSNLTTVTTSVLNPVGIAFDNSGNLIVAEHSSSKITKVDSGGNTTLIKGGLGYVTGVVVDSHDKIYVVSYTTGKIYKMDADGSNSVVFATVLNGTSTVVGSLIGLGIDANDNLYLSDQRNSRILKIDPSGVQSDFTSVTSPYWASVGKDGYVYASSLDKTIQKFDLSGSKIETYSTGTYTPWGNQVDADGSIYFVYNGATVNRILGYADTVDRTHVKITLVYDMVSGVADASAFAISGVASNPQVTSAVVNGSEIDLTLDSNIEYTDTNVKVNYTKTGINNIVQQGTSIEISNFSDLSVVNNLVSVTTIGTLSTINVDNGTILSAVSLPKIVSVGLSNLTTTSAAVVWDGGTPTYDGDTSGTYTFKGTLSLGNHIYNSENKKAVVDVVVTGVPIPTVTTMSAISMIGVSNGTKLSVVGLPTTVSFSLSNSTTTSAAVVWDGGTPTYDGDTAGIYVFTGTIASSSDYVNPSNLKASVNVVVQAVTSSNNKNNNKSNLRNLNYSAVVKLNGVEKKVANEVRTIENGKSKVEVSINNMTMKKIIDDLPEGVTSLQTPVKNLVEINVQDTTADSTVIGLNGEIVKQMDQNKFDVWVNIGDKTYKIPAEELEVDAVASKLGVDKENLKSIQFYIQLDTFTSEEQTEITKKVESNNGKIIVKPVEFKISAVAIQNDGTNEIVEINTFKQFVMRRFEIPNDVNTTDITTGVVFDRDYNYSQVPTNIYIENGKTYAEINSLTNSIYSVISNPVTVNSVKGHWSESIVNDMASRLILTDYYQFKADKNVTRGEFATYMIRALGLYKGDTNFETSFTDVKNTNENALGISLAGQWSLISGYEDGTFKPNNEITREEAMVLIAKAMEIANYEGATGASNFEIEANEGISNWFKPYIQKVLDGKVFVGRSDNDLALKQNLTHAETLAALRNLLIKAELINEK
jgi:sugar lactone lactonase YvrE